MIMPTQSESAVAVSGKPSKTVELLRKRLRQLRRVIAVSPACIAVAAMVLAIWWHNSLNVLPDIGNPFDVAALRAFSIPRTGMNSSSSGGRTGSVAPFTSGWTERLRPRRPPGPEAIRRSAPGSSQIALSRDGLVTLAPDIRLPADEEGLTAHRLSVDLHFDNTPGAR